MANTATPTPANNLSDITDPSGIGQLPVRAERRIIPASISVSAAQTIYDHGAQSNGDHQTHERVVSSDFRIVAAKKDLTDFVKIRIPHRGVPAATNATNPNQVAEFKFLINPKTVSVSKQTVDTQAFTRGGWQFGVWGEDISQIRLSGQTSGSYFALGLTDEYQYFAQSYRNLLQLQQVFENNGYWFEGEEFNEGPLAADYLRRRIRVHQDIELWVGNFIWSGMFESMTVSQNAENPFIIEFDMTFLAWKERYRSSSGYWDNKHNDVQRGHSYSAVQAVVDATASNVKQAQTSAISNYTRSSQMTQTLSQSYNGSSPSTQAAAAGELLPTIDPQVRTTMGPINDLVGDPSTNPLFTGRTV